MSCANAYKGAAVSGSTCVPAVPSSIRTAPRLASANLLEWMTPLGKRLGDCTGHEIAALAALFNELVKSKPVS